MIKYLLLFLVISFYVLAQNGPAGVGNSSNNVLWLKADAGTSSTINGTPISSWNDQSGNGINVTQTITTRQPVFTTNVTNGFPAIMFDNVTSTNDKLVAPDNDALDNTTGYSFFTVTRPVSYATSGSDRARVILSKRNNVDTDESFMLFHYSSNHFYVDIQKTDNRFNSSPTAFGLGTNCLINVIYDGTLTTATRSKLYSGETLIKTATESNSLIPNNNSPLIIGSTDIGDARPFGGYISEIIVYRQSLNKASRIIVNNYLSAKYNIPLSTNDKYAGDNLINGDFDRDVAGIGYDTIMPGSVAGDNSSFSPSSCAGLGVNYVSGFDAGDYVIAGHSTINNSLNITDIAGISGTEPARWQRIWYIDVTNTNTTLQTNIEFDMAAGGMITTSPTIPSNYKLLYRSSNSGTWTEKATASSISGNKIIFSSYSFNNNLDDGYYTIGTMNYSISPLPIELILFNVKLDNNKVNINWSTASEINNDYFVIEKSKDGVYFEIVNKIKATGNSSSMVNYNDVDLKPFEGISYYRLKQIDFDGNYFYSKTVAIENYSISLENEISVFPNPTENEITLNFKGKENQKISIRIIDMLGKEYYSEVITTQQKNNSIYINLNQKLPAGTYILNIFYNEKVNNQIIIIK